MSDGNETFSELPSTLIVTNLDQLNAVLALICPTIPTSAEALMILSFILDFIGIAFGIMGMVLKYRRGNLWFVKIVNRKSSFTFSVQLLIEVIGRLRPHGTVLVPFFLILYCIIDLSVDIPLLITGLQGQPMTKFLWAFTIKYFPIVSGSLYGYCDVL